MKEAALSGRSPQAKAENMPCYFLHLFDAARSVFDDVGTDLPDERAAFEYATECLREVIANDILAQVPLNPEGYMSVQDQVGHELCRVYVREIAGVPTP